MNPSQKTYGVNFACLCPSFTETNMLTDALNTDNPGTITYAENKEHVHHVIDLLGINRYII